MSLIFRAFVLSKQKHHLIISTFADSVAIHCDGKVSSGVSSSLLVAASRVYIQNTEKKKNTAANCCLAKRPCELQCCNCEVTEEHYTGGL